MRLHNITEINAFNEVLSKCEGKVWLESTDGDVYNLNSALSVYVALGALLSEQADKLELYCQNANDERLFYELFDNYPEIP